MKKIKNPRTPKRSEAKKASPKAVFEVTESFDSERIYTYHLTKEAAGDYITRGRDMTWNEERSTNTADWYEGWSDRDGKSETCEAVCEKVKYRGQEICFNFTRK